MSLRALFWSRLALGVLSFAFFLLYATQYRNYRASYAHLTDKYSKLVLHSDGLSAQLQLMMERNQRTEKLLKDLRTKHAQIMKENNDKQQKIDEQRLLCEEKLKKCLAGVTTSTGHMEVEEQSGNEKEVIKYQDRFLQCQKELNEFKNEVEGLKEEIKNSSNLNDKCQKQLRSLQQIQQSQTTNYVQDGKVHFDRQGHLNEELEFRRNPAPPQFPTLLSRKELLEKLRKRNENREKIPENGAEIVDIPEVNEHEYKDYKDANVST